MEDENSEWLNFFGKNPHSRILKTLIKSGGEGKELSRLGIVKISGVATGGGYKFVNFLEKKGCVVKRIQGKTMKMFRINEKDMIMKNLIEVYHHLNSMEGSA